ncbi:MAG: hypothetical protein IIB05_03100 [Bacteroidetes bacterium]|nr:hypothetical protein [Bacteroidota bacterium]
MSELMDNSRIRINNLLAFSSGIVEGKDGSEKRMFFSLLHWKLLMKNIGTKWLIKAMI